MPSVSRRAGRRAADPQAVVSAQGEGGGAGTSTAARREGDAEKLLTENPSEQVLEAKQESARG